MKLGLLRLYLPRGHETDEPLALGALGVFALRRARLWPPFRGFVADWLHPTPPVAIVDPPGRPRAERPPPGECVGVAPVQTTTVGAPARPGGAVVADRPLRTEDLIIFRGQVFWRGSYAGRASRLRFDLLPSKGIPIPMIPRGVLRGMFNRLVVTVSEDGKIRSRNADAL